MEVLNPNSQNNPLCPYHREKQIGYYCSVSKCPHALLCDSCIKSHLHPYLPSDTIIHDLNSILSDEAFIGFQKKLNTSISSSDHNNAIVAFIESFFVKFQTEITKIVDEAKRSLIDKVEKQGGGENFPIDAIKIELDGLREEFLRSQPEQRLEKMSQYVKKIVEVSTNIAQSEKRKMNVPLINHDEYERFLSQFKKRFEAYAETLFEQPPEEPKLDNLLVRKEVLLERIPGLTLTSDKAIVDWIGKKVTPQNVEDLKVLLTVSSDVSNLKLCFGKYYIWGAKGSNITDADLENSVIDSVLRMKSLKRLKVNLTKNPITNKSLETLKKLGSLTHMKKIFISFYETSVTTAEAAEFAKFLGSKLEKTKVIVRDKEGNHLHNTPNGGGEKEYKKKGSL